MLAFPARVLGLNDSLVTFPALAITVGEGQVLTVPAMDFGLGPVDRLPALPAEVSLTFVGVMEPFTAPAARTLQNACITIRVTARSQRSSLTTKQLSSAFTSTRTALNFAPRILCSQSCNMRVLSWETSVSSAKLSRSWVRFAKWRGANRGRERSSLWPTRFIA